MWSLTPPGMDPGDTYDLCISRVVEQPLARQLVRARPEVVAAAASFDVAAAKSEWYLLDAAKFKPIATTSAQMKSTYSNRMVRAKAPGKPSYDMLITSAPHGICPLCGHRPVSTLDHYLPKSEFPLLAVTPRNLIPACSDCNHDKRDAQPKDALNQTLHPYFDNADDTRWLYAELQQVAPATVIFRADPDSKLGAVPAARIRNHFDALNLNALYAAQAAAELRSIELALQRAFDRAGAPAVRQQLHDQADSRRVVHANSWQVALYECLAGSDWFCDGGFKS